MLFIGSRNIVVLEIWYTVFMCVCVCVRVHIYVCVCVSVAWNGTLWPEKYVMMQTLSNDTVTPVFLASQTEAICEKTRIKWKVPSDKMVCSCCRVGFFQALLECKKLKICAYLCDGYREFFHFMPHYRERGGKMWEKLRGVVQRCVFVCVCV